MEPLEATRLPWAQGVGRSNRPAPTKSSLILKELILYQPSNGLVFFLSQRVRGQYVPAWNNDYFLSVQYAEHGKGAIHNLIDLKQIPLRAPNPKQPTTLDSVVKPVNRQSPAEIDHYQIQRVADVYATPTGEDLSKLTAAIRRALTDAKLHSNIRVA